MNLYCYLSIYFFAQTLNWPNQNFLDVTIFDMWQNLKKIYHNAQFTSSVVFCHVMSYLPFLSYRGPLGIQVQIFFLTLFSIKSCQNPYLQLDFWENWWVKLDIFQNRWVQLSPFTYPNVTTPLLVLFSLWDYTIYLVATAFSSAQKSYECRKISDFTDLPLFWIPLYVYFLRRRKLVQNFPLHLKLIFPICNA